MSFQIIERTDTFLYPHQKSLLDRKEQTKLLWKKK